MARRRNIGCKVFGHPGPGLRVPLPKDRRGMPGDQHRPAMEAGLDLPAPGGHRVIPAGQGKRRRGTKRQHKIWPDKAQLQPEPPAAVQDLLPVGV